MKKVINRISAAVAGIAVILVAADAATAGAGLVWALGWMLVAVLAYRVWKRTDEGEEEEV